MAAARLGGRLIDISRAIEDYVRSQPHPLGGSWGIVEEYVGHGIGTEMHQDPQVHNYVGPRMGQGPGDRARASRSRSSRWSTSAGGTPGCSTTAGPS